MKIRLLNEARPPARPYPRRSPLWVSIVAGTLIGTGLGAILFFGWIPVGALLFVAGCWLAFEKGIAR